MYKLICAKNFLLGQTGKVESIDSVPISSAEILLPGVASTNRMTLCCCMSSRFRPISTQRGKVPFILNQSCCMLTNGIKGTSIQSLFNDKQKHLWTLFAFCYLSDEAFHS